MDEDKQISGKKKENLKKMIKNRTKKGNLRIPQLILLLLMVVLKLILMTANMLKIIKNFILLELFYPKL